MALPWPRRRGLPDCMFLGMSADVKWIPEASGYDGKVCLPLILTRPWVSKRQPIKWLKRQAAAKRRTSIVPFGNTIRS